MSNLVDLLLYVLAVAAVTWVVFWTLVLGLVLLLVASETRRR